MKQSIHPTYYPIAKVHCACGRDFTVGSTMETLEVEICSQCHPFFTGQAKVLDAAGRVERFKTRAAKSRVKKESVAVKKPRRRNDAKS